MTQIIRAIWPSYLNIHNTIPLSVGITTQQMCSHVLFWSLQFPFLLIPPHKLRWFFVFKTVIVVITSVAVVIALCVQAGGAGDIWVQKATVSGSTKSWLILSSMSSITGSWCVEIILHGQRFHHYKPKLSALQVNDGNQYSRLHSVSEEISRCLLASTLHAFYRITDRNIWHHCGKCWEGFVWYLYLGPTAARLELGRAKRTCRCILRWFVLGRRTDWNEHLGQCYFLLQRYGKHSDTSFDSGDSAKVFL